MLTDPRGNCNHELASSTDTSSGKATLSPDERGPLVSIAPVTVRTPCGIEERGDSSSEGELKSTRDMSSATNDRDADMWNVNLVKEKEAREYALLWR